MYRCQITGKNSKPGNPHATPYPIAAEKLNKIVVATREKVYTKKVRNEETNKWEDVEIGHGWEIVRELNVNAEGLALWNSWNEDERTAFLTHMNS